MLGRGWLMTLPVADVQKWKGAHGGVKQGWYGTVRQNFDHAMRCGPQTLREPSELPRYEVTRYMDTSLAPRKKPNTICTSIQITNTYIINTLSQEYSFS